MGRVNKSENMCMFCEFVFFSSCEFILYIFDGSTTAHTHTQHGFTMYISVRLWWYVLLALNDTASVVRHICMCICVWMYLLLLWWFPLFAISFSLFTVVVVIVVIVVVSQMLSSHQVHFLYSFSFLLLIALSLSFAFIIPMISMAQVKHK